jgi:hypothetical protein
VDEIFITFLVPILCGYLLISLVPQLSLSVKAYDEDGYRIIMRSLLCGFAWMFAVIYVHGIGADLMYGNPRGRSGWAMLPGSQDLRIMLELKDRADQSEYIFWFVLPLIGAVGISKLPIAASWFNKLEQKYEERFLRRNGDYLWDYIIKSQAGSFPLLITLKSRKVYVAYIAKRPSLLHNTGRKSLVIWPIKSGFRDKDTLEIETRRLYWIFFELMEQQTVADAHFKIQPLEPFCLRFTADGVERTRKISYAAYKHMIDHYGIAIDWHDIESIIPFIPEIYEAPHTIR